MSSLTSFQWVRHPEAAAFVNDQLRTLVARLEPLQAFATRLVRLTGSGLSDWVDHLVIADSEATRRQLAELGFGPEEVPAGPGETVFCHPGTMLPRLVLRRVVGEGALDIVGVALHVEEIAAFQMMNHLSQPIEGTPLGPYRRAIAWQAGGLEVSVVERRGNAGFVPTILSRSDSQASLLAFEQWAMRPRLFPDDVAGMRQTLEIARSLVASKGVHRAAWIAFAAEREYWQRRNRAAQVQKARQDGLGLGWANHDHHTFRSSRQTFPLLIEILETFGFHPRERFYAGAEAGWGAQVMEQPVCRLAVFADVDLSPDEVAGDFAHRTLTPQPRLGTVGLWCALHGEAMLGAGLHHLAGRFDFDAVTEGLAQLGTSMMRPFSEFPYLRQAFTQGERWQVAPDRLARLVSDGPVSKAQGAQFAERGAVGSHLENIQRADGFKGFNQTMISDIIRRTDPRTETEGDERAAA